jgi:hypothetical protein
MMPNPGVNIILTKWKPIRVCELSDKQAVSCVIDGIQNDVIQTGARAGRYENPEVLYSSFLSTLVTQKAEGQREQQSQHKTRPTFKDNRNRREDRNVRMGASFPRHKPKCLDTLYLSGQFLLNHLI